MEFKEANPGDVDIVSPTNRHSLAPAYIVDPLLSMGY